MVVALPARSLGELLGPFLGMALGREAHSGTPQGPDAKILFQDGVKIEIGSIPTETVGGHPPVSTCRTSDGWPVSAFRTAS